MSSHYREVHHYHHGRSCQCRRCLRLTPGEAFATLGLLIVGHVVASKLEEHNRREEARDEARRRLLGGG